MGADPAGSEPSPVILGGTHRPGEPIVRVVATLDAPQVTHLSWDTEGGERSHQNLLRRPIEVRPLTKTRPGPITGIGKRIGSDGVEWGLSGLGAEVDWRIQVQGGELTMAFRAGATEGAVELLHVILPFDPVTTPTTALPAQWESDGSLRLPAIICAPDFGQMLVTASPRSDLRGRLAGSRKERTVDLVLELPVRGRESQTTLRFQPLRLPAPIGLRDDSLWAAARRGWFGALQCSAEWGDPGNPFSAPAGMLANNVISDPASCSLWFYADQAFFTPTLAPGVSAMKLVQRTLDWWLDNKILPSGEMICYWDKTHFLDANSGPLIAAWDYVEVTDDRAWLIRRIERLELLAEYLARRDVDGDGLVEAVQSGNAGTLREPGRSCAWWDALNCGHKDSYSNALIYRAWRCLADLEARLDRSEKQRRYNELADRLKAAYLPTLFNPSNGWLAWWKSEDGALHDYASPVINGLAIEYGLVPPAQGREMLNRLRRKMAEVGFTRFDLGVPPLLTPVRREDYLFPNAPGGPKREDGSDTLGYYMNGGITAGQVLHFLAAHYVVGDGAEADRVLRAMLGRQARGEFQNGAVNAYPKGIDWTTWDGQPAGYEGYLADSFRFLQAVLLREPQFRERLYRPLAGRTKA